MRQQRILRIGLALTLGLALGGCESFEGMDGWFSTKKPLPGDRKAVFPDGVPGVPQGVPPELVRGYQPPPEPPPVIVEAPKPPPKVRPRPKRVAAPAQQPTSITVQRQSAPPAGQRPQDVSTFPAPQQQPAAAPAQTSSPFPPPPPPPR